jgi:hypothetical protein
MSEKVTTGHIDERFDVVEQRLESLSQKADANVAAIDALDSKIDANAEAAEARFHILEARLPGHSDDQIIDLIDARLQSVLPDMLREAVTDGLVAPLSLVQDSINASQSNSAAIEALAEAVETVKCDVSAVRASTTPIVEIVDGLQFIRRFLIGAGGLAGSALVIWAALSGILS